MSAAVDIIPQMSGGGKAGCPPPYPACGPARKTARNTYIFRSKNKPFYGKNPGNERIFRTAHTLPVRLKFLCHNSIQVILQ
jgi:hypothetical protein